MKTFNKALLILLFAAMWLPSSAKCDSDTIYIYPEMVEHFTKRSKQRSNARAIKTNDFKKMYDIVKETSFDDTRLQFVTVASFGSYFTCVQCAKILSLFSFEKNRLKALELFAPRIVDMKGVDDIINSFSFDSNKEEAIKILGNSGN